jgi:hypothetical protein
LSIGAAGGDYIFLEETSDPENRISGYDGLVVAQGYTDNDSLHIVLICTAVGEFELRVYGDSINLRAVSNTFYAAGTITLVSYGISGTLVVDDVSDMIETEVYIADGLWGSDQSCTNGLTLVNGVLTLETASATSPGALSAADWVRFEGGGTGGKVIRSGSTADGNFAVWNGTDAEIKDGGTPGSAAFADTGDFDAAGAAAARMAKVPAATEDHIAIFDDAGQVVDGGAIPAGSVVATGAEINTGTDDVKFASAKAIADSALVFRSGSTTDDHIASWNGNDADSIQDGGVLGTAAHAATGDFDAAGAAAARMAKVPEATENHLAIFDAAGQVKDGGATPAIPVKATGAEVNTGTDDAKFVTAKAVADSKIVSGPVSITDGNLAVWDTNAKTLKDGGAPGSGGGVTVDDEGTPLATTATELDFVGAGVTASGTGAKKTITIPGGGGGSITIKDEGSALTTAADTLNFTGAGVTASGTGAEKTITIPGGSTDEDIEAAADFFGYMMFI